jgi:hypothetical protein
MAPDDMTTEAAFRPSGERSRVEQHGCREQRADVA